MRLFSALLVTLCFNQTHVQATLIRKSTLLGKTSITVCFARGLSDLKHPGMAKNEVMRFTEKDVKFLSIEEHKIEPFPSELISPIREAVQKSFLNSGLEFEGFEYCDSNHLTDVAIYYSDLEDQSMGVGEIGDVKKVDPSLSQNNIRIGKAFNQGTEHDFHDYIAALERKHSVKLDHTTLAQRWKMAFFLRGVVHEFGHIAGLLHENNRRDGDKATLTHEFYPALGSAKRVIRMSKDFASQYGKAGTKHKFDDEILGEFDYFSVMNYSYKFNMSAALVLEAVCLLKPALEVCDFEKINLYLPLERENGFLSDQDIAGLRYYYLGKSPINFSPTSLLKALTPWLHEVKTAFGSWTPPSTKPAVRSANCVF